jgi:hypothetical protein
LDPLLDGAYPDEPGCKDAICIEYDNLRTLPASVVVCPPPSDEIRVGSRIIVTVKTSFSPLAPFVNMPPIPIEAVTKRTILKEVFLEDY